MSGIVSQLEADVLNEIINSTLPFYLKNKLFKQNIEEKPTVKKMREVQKEFPGGPDVRLNAKGNYDAHGEWINDDGPVNFRNPTGTLQAIYPWYAMHDGIEIGYQALKAAGFSVGDSGKASEHSKNDAIRITNYLEQCYGDLDESIPMTMNNMFWADGSQDAAASPGIPFFISDTPTTGIVGSISRASNSWWRNRALVGASKISYSRTNQTLTHTLQEEGRQLRRYGGSPKFFPAGSKFMKALEIEAYAKGNLTMTGFGGKTTVGVQAIDVKGLGTVEYEPQLDNLGMEDRLYAIDTDGIHPMVMEGEEFKAHMPARPHNIFKIYKSVTWTGMLTAQRLNSSGVYQVDGTGL